MTIGFLDPFYSAIAWVLIHIHGLLAVPFGTNSGWSWGLAIVVLVVGLRLVLVPLFIKQMKSQGKMVALQPQVAALRKRYKDDKQTMNQEMMKLYQDNGANPLMGCLPLLAQLPVWFALFDVLDAVSKGEAKFGFTPALVHSALHAKIITATLSTQLVTSYLPPYHLAPGPWSGKVLVIVAALVSAALTFLTTNQMMKRGIGQMSTDPDAPGASMQKSMKWISPLFALSGLAWPFGVVIYWVVSYSWQLGQTTILYGRYVPKMAGAGAAGAGAAVPVPAAGFTAGTVTGSKGAAGSSERPGQPRVSRGTAAKMVPQKTTTRSTGTAKDGAATGCRANRAAKPTAGAGAGAANRAKTAGGAANGAKSGDNAANGTRSGGGATKATAKNGTKSTVKDGAGKSTVSDKRTTTGKPNGSTRSSGSGTAAAAAGAKASVPAASSPGGTGRSADGTGTGQGGRSDGRAGGSDAKLGADKSGTDSTSTTSDTAQPQRQRSGRSASRTAGDNSRRPAAPDNRAGAGSGKPTASTGRPAGRTDGGEKRGLGRLVRGKPETDETPAEPPVQIVRQQRVRQSRSQRSGKR